MNNTQFLPVSTVFRARTVYLKRQPAMERNMFEKNRHRNQNGRMYTCTTGCQKSSE